MFFTSVIYCQDSIFFVLVLIFIIFLLEIFGWFPGLLVHICVGLWNVALCFILIIFLIEILVDLQIYCFMSVGPRIVADCLFVCFFLSILLIFFFWCGCPMEGGCPSPGAGWAYPRAGHGEGEGDQLDLRASLHQLREFNTWVSSKESSRLC